MKGHSYACYISEGHFRVIDKYMENAYLLPILTAHSMIVSMVIL